jgi:FkbM family methyltransferase
MGLASRAWGQIGLGTLYKLVGGVPGLDQTRCTVELSPGSFLDIPVFEPCWGPVAIGGRPYEPELMHLFRRLRGIDVTLVDCGANYGYWSVVATGQEIGFRFAVAIEPNPTTFNRLRQNSELNSAHFRCVQRAISDETGQLVTLADSEHHIIAYVDPNAVNGPRVETTTVDAVLDQLDWATHDYIVIKLDVEGSEVKAISGARATCENHDHLFIVEDWRSSRFETSRALLEMGYPYYYVTRKGRCISLSSLADVESAVASDRKIAHGTNFMAAKKGGVFHARLEEWRKEN